jgi:hypothetical protein
MRAEADYMYLLTAILTWNGFEGPGSIAGWSRQADLDRFKAKLKQMCQLLKHYFLQKAEISLSLHPSISKVMLDLDSSFTFYGSLQILAVCGLP